MDRKRALEARRKYEHQKPYWCEKHKRKHVFGSKVYDKCSWRFLVYKE